MPVVPNNEVIVQTIINHSIYNSMLDIKLRQK